MSSCRTNSAKDKIEQISVLLNYHYKSFEDRRSYHWKMNFFLWGGIVAIVGAILRTQRFPPHSASMIFSAALLLLYVFDWMRGLKKAHAINKKFCDRYCELIRQWSENPNQDTNADRGLPKYEDIVKKVTWQRWKDVPKWKIFFDWSSRTEILFTMLLLVAALWVTWQPDEKSEKGSSTYNRTEKKIERTYDQFENSTLRRPEQHHASDTD